MQTNVVPDGPLAGTDVRATLFSDCHQVPIGPVSVAQLDYLELPPLGAEKWLPSSLFHPVTIQKQRKMMKTPVEISISPRVPLVMSVDNYGGKGKEKLVESVTCKLEMRGPNGEVHTLQDTSRMTLHFARSVFPMIQQALRSPSSLSNQTIGIIDAGEGKETSTSMYMVWETSAEGTLLSGTALSCWNENGARWRLVQTSRDATQTVWALDFFSFFIDHAELAGPLPEASVSLYLTPAAIVVGDGDGGSGDAAAANRIKLATSVEAVQTDDCSPFDNSSSLRAVNLTAQFVELSPAGTPEGDRGWVVTLSGTVDGKPLQRELDQATVSQFQDFKTQPSQVPFLISSSKEMSTQWWAQKTTPSSPTFMLLWVVVKNIS
jgi:hypothetical protein